MIALNWALLTLWGLALLAAFVLGKFNPERTRYAHRPTLLLTSALLAATAALFVWQARNTPLAGFALLVTLGMAASFVGDLIMAEYLRTPERVLFGLLAFGAAHALYSGGFWSGARALKATITAAGWGAAAGFLVLGVSLWAVIVRGRPIRPALKYGALGYALLICVMTGLAAALGLARPYLRILPLGAILFLASDMILAAQIFRGWRWFLINDVVWALYISGQALIVWSNWAALRGPD